MCKDNLTALEEEIIKTEKTVEYLKDAIEKGLSYNDLELEQIGQAGIGATGEGLAKDPAVQEVIDNIEGTDVGGLNYVSVMSTIIASYDLISGKDLGQTKLDVEYYRVQKYLEALNQAYNQETWKQEEDGEITLPDVPIP
jgi:hypothetical protein